MTQIHHERSVVTEDSPGTVVDDYPVRRANPAPIIAGICIALLLLFLVLFGMNRMSNDGGGDTDDGGTRITLPTNDDADTGGSGGTDTGNETDTGTSNETETETQTSTP